MVDWTLITGASRAFKEAAMTEPEVTVSETGNGRDSEEINIGNHTIHSDEPTSRGGTNR